MKFHNPVWRIRSVNWLFFDWLVRSSKTSLLERLQDFHNPVLVGGCQRSGTTAVTEVLSSAQEITNFKIGIDNELDGALILSGAYNFRPDESSRYCFQVTYLNESLLELCEVPEEFKMVWVVRNPYSVVFSMLRNWRASALDQLYRSCTSTPSVYTDNYSPLLEKATSEQSRLIKACICYCVRSSQLFELAASRTQDKLYVIDYDVLVAEPKRIMPQIFRFADLSMGESQLNMINPNSLMKASKSLSSAEHKFVEKVCQSTYSRCLEFVSK